MKFTLIATLVMFASMTLSPLALAGSKKHLFILSGQSNMALLNPKLSFTPTVESEFGKRNVIVVKEAQGTQPIQRWYKEWKPKNGPKPKGNGDLYDTLMDKVKKAVKGQKMDSVTFVWMQGERDARLKHGDVYKESLLGVIDQIKADLKLKELHVVIGRINDYGNSNKSHPHWTMIRDIQVEVAKSQPSGEWVDTDDLNGKKNDIHATGNGYKTLGKRFAEASIKLIKGK